MNRKQRVKTINDMDENKIKEISCAFFRYWWNAEGTNTEQGFDKWWNNTGKSLVESDCISDVVGSYNLKVGDKIKMPSGLKAEVIKTKVKVKDEFGGEYYLSDIEVG